MKFSSYLTAACIAISLASGTAFAAGTSVKPLPMPENCYGERTPDAKINRVVLHFCSDFIKAPDDPFNIKSIQDIFTSAGVSAHYVIARDGTVYQMVDEKKKAYHAGGGVLPFDKSTSGVLNNTSIGIEMTAVGSESDMVPLFVKKEAYDAFKAKHPDFIGFTDAQYTALNKLLKEIEARHPEIQHDRRHIVTHEEYAGRERRTDPGELFDFARVGLNKYAPLQREREYRGVDMNSANIFWRNMRFEQIWAQLVDIKPGDRTIVMLGDSITEGFPAENIGPYKVINEGINSDQIDNPTLPIGIMRRLDLVKLAKPEHIFCTIGINDICAGETTDTLKAQYLELYDTLKAEFPKTKIHVSPVFPVTTAKYQPRMSMVNEVNTFIKAEALKRGFSVLDLTKDFSDAQGFLKADFTADGVHLKKPAYDIWIRHITKILNK